MNSRIPPGQGCGPSGHRSLQRVPPGTSVVTFSEGSEATQRRDSLPALSHAETAPTTLPVASSIGGRALQCQRLLELDSQGALQIPPLRHPAVFECPFNFLNCLMTFTSFSEWLRHSQTHFGKVEPPTRNKCCFCDRTFAAPKGKASWREKLEHVQLHHQLGHRLAHARPDFELYLYLWQKRVIDDVQYRALLGESSRATAERGTPGAYTVFNDRSRERRRR
jgi:hypothetical protein